MLFRSSPTSALAELEAQLDAQQRPDGVKAPRTQGEQGAIDAELLAREHAAGAILRHSTPQATVVQATTAPVAGQLAVDDLVDTPLVVQALQHRQRPVLGAALRPVNVGVPQEVYDGLEAFCRRHRTTKRAVVSLLLDELLRGEP